MAFIILRVFYGLYFLGTAVIFYHILSNLIFRKPGVSHSVGFEQALLLFFWPLAFFSQNGRKKLKNLKKNF